MLNFFFFLLLYPYKVEFDEKLQDDLAMGPCHVVLGIHIANTAAYPELVLQLKMSNWESQSALLPHRAQDSPPNYPSAVARQIF